MSEEKKPTICGLPVIFSNEVTPALEAAGITFGDFGEFIVAEPIPAPREYDADERL